jgi:hypothetical protein
VERLTTIKRFPTELQALNSINVIRPTNIKIIIFLNMSMVYKDYKHQNKRIYYGENHNLDAALLKMPFSFNMVYDIDL